VDEVGDEYGKFAVQENFRSCEGLRAKNKRGDHYSVHWIVCFRAVVLERGLWRRGAVVRMKV
jgi:hypothetical protein